MKDIKNVKKKQELSREELDELGRAAAQIMERRRRAKRRNKFLLLASIPLVGALVGNLGYNVLDARAAKYFSDVANAESIVAEEEWAKEYHKGRFEKLLAESKRAMKRAFVYGWFVD